MYYFVEVSGHNLENS